MLWNGKNFNTTFSDRSTEFHFNRIMDIPWTNYLLNKQKFVCYFTIYPVLFNDECKTRYCDGGQRI